jgi:hypothetical protein
MAGEVEIPAADKNWHSLAIAWYESLAKSGQSGFYEPSDWAAARYVAELMSRGLERSHPSAQLFSSLWGAMGDLLTTEAQRRRLRVEVERELGEAPVPAGVTALDEYRRTLGA